MKINHLVLISAMPEELGETIENLKAVKKVKYGDITLYSGIYNLNGIELKVSLAWSGWGKVCASRAITRLISSSLINIPIDLILFTGVAGAVNPELKKLDFVIGKELMQYDIDASPLFEKYTIPALNLSKLKCSPELINIGREVAQKTLLEFSLTKKNIVKEGLIGTADQFISDEFTLNKLRKDIPDLDAIEMEGAAIAQIAYQEKIPFLVIRVISDSANGEASKDFSEFINEYKQISWFFIKIFFEYCIERCQKN